MSGHGLVRRAPTSGFTLVEVVVSMGLFSVFTLGLLAAFDGANRINKTQLQSAEIQQSLRSAMFEIQRNVRMAGVGDLPVTQAILAADPLNNATYNNAANYAFTDVGGVAHPVRPGTDILEIRGVIDTSLVALTSAGCGTCVGTADAIVIPEVTRYGVRNNDAAQFQLLESAFSQPGQHLFVVSSQEVNAGPGGGFANVALMSSVALQPANARAVVIGDFTHADARRFNGVAPYGVSSPISLAGNIRGGLLDDIVFFLDNSDPQHPSLAMGVLRQVNPRLFEILSIATNIEDLQFAYGIDGADGTAPDGSISNTSSPVAGGDEWVPNVKTEAAAGMAAFVGPASPRLRSILVAVVSKAPEPDVAFRGRPGSSGVLPLDSAAVPVSTRATDRKTMLLRVNLRNFNRGA